MGLRAHRRLDAHLRRRDGKSGLGVCGGGVTAATSVARAAFASPTLAPATAAASAAAPIVAATSAAAVRLVGLVFLGFRIGFWFWPRRGGGVAAASLVDGDLGGVLDAVGVPLCPELAHC